LPNRWRREHLEATAEKCAELRKRGAESDEASAQVLANTTEALARSYDLLARTAKLTTSPRSGGPKRR